MKKKKSSTIINLHGLIIDLEDIKHQIIIVGIIVFILYWFGYIQ